MDSGVKREILGRMVRDLVRYGVQLELKPYSDTLLRLSGVGKPLIGNEAQILERLKVIGGAIGAKLKNIAETQGEVPTGTTGTTEERNPDQEDGTIDA